MKYVTLVGVKKMTLVSDTGKRIDGRIPSKISREDRTFTKQISLKSEKEAENYYKNIIDNNVYDGLILHYSEDSEAKFFETSEVYVLYLSRRSVE
jgi:hypothetical protein